MESTFDLTTFLSALPGGQVLWAFCMFVLVLGVLVTIHEFGHYLAARSVGVHVIQFSIGFGKEIYGWTDKVGTRWSVCWIPLGGYVRMFGDDEEETISKADESKAFLFKNVWQRMWVVFAGPLANFILAFVFLSALMISGEQKISPKIGEVLPDSAAMQAGLLEGDVILSINQTPILSWFDVLSLVKDAKEKEMLIGVDRQGAYTQITVLPEMMTHKTASGEVVHMPFVGISPSEDRFYVQHGFLEGIKLGAVKTYDYTVMVLDGLWKIVSGRASAENIGGPIMIAEVAGEAGQQGLYPLIMLMVIISINLGILNLLPIPVLDGGHLLFYIIEAIKGKPLGERAQNYGYKLGMIFIGGLMLLAIGNDLRRVLVNLMPSDLEQEQEITEQESK